jgi:membrane-associated phospholipid phosphatase
LVCGQLSSGAPGNTEQSILLLIHSHVPNGMTNLFHAITFTGSAAFLIPLAAATVIGLLVARRRFEAALVSSSVIAGAAIVYLLKAAVGRARPDLWDSEWYWGSSFPSGHTLEVAAFATAAAVCIGRIWPAQHRVAAAAMGIWITLVALSRLVLGAHWLSDVAAAAGIGTFLPFAMMFGRRLFLRGREPDTRSKMEPQP